MNAKKRVLILGLIPEVVDYSRWPGLTPEKLMAQLTADEGKLNELGYKAQLCLVDLGETAGATVTQTVSTDSFDCVVIGAGVRTAPELLLFFEKLINLVHQYAPSAKICFNSKPSDTSEAVQRWI